MKLHWVGILGFLIVGCSSARPVARPAQAAASAPEPVVASSPSKPPGQMDIDFEAPPEPEPVATPTPKQQTTATSLPHTLHKAQLFASPDANK